MRVSEFEFVWLLSSIVIRRHHDVVMVGPLVLRHKTEEARAAGGVGGLVLDFDVPLGGFRFAALPGFAVHHTASVLGHIDARLDSVPGVGSPFERDGTFDAFLVRTDFYLLGVAFE